ncbi:probable G-protein coupled receptor Mth-like 3 [Macrosteles quadrilineatus]|uniref:probable G-protein coupled receptor Mth-like 3 n=1 Tax=Macrosteles quadrilineatus TaxID=74068 RepID=UPI0023E232BF|nr:probable G-protein coupled receptor Mth-like 3 [Macrosteles quadrilineatus]
MGRVSIAVCCFLFLIAVVGVPLVFHIRANRPLDTPCHENHSVALSNPIFHENGSIENDGDLYPSGHHFTLNGTHRGCLCMLHPCVRKCCDKDEYYVRVPGSRAKCVHNPEPSPFENFSLPVHEAPGKRVDVDRDHFRLLYGDVCSPGKYILDPEDERDQHYLLVDGRINFMDSDHLEVSNYCLESMNGSDEIRTFVCLPDSAGDEVTRAQQFLYPLGMIISMPCLLITIVVYSILPALRNLHGKCLVCQCTCLLLTYIGLTIAYLKGGVLEDCWCVFIAFMIQFTFLAGSFWLNVMSFDIWWSFSGRRPARWGKKGMDHKKFLLYSLYAWGMPLVIVTISVAIDLAPSIPDSIIKPDFGKAKCWFAEWKAALLYFYIPSGVILVHNLYMFVSTALTLHSYTKKGREKVRFYLYLKLFIVMGLNWTLDILSFLIGGPESFWLVTDLCNTLQGLAIFFFFVCKSDVLQKLKLHLCPSWSLRKSQEYSNSVSTCGDETKTEIDILALKTLDDDEKNKYKG